MLTNASSGHIGGVEKQTSLMARWLARRGHRVSLITWDEGQPDGVEIDGVRVFKLCRRDDGIPGLRFLHPRWTSLNRALSRADADVYYQNCGEYVTGQVALWCRRHARPFIFSAAHDHDCIRSLPFLRTFRERTLYRYGLRQAAELIVQTRAQQRTVREDFGRDAIVIPMPCPGPTEDCFIPSQRPDPSAARILWVGRLTEEKRPDRFLDLAETCPDLSFDLVGPAGDDVYVQRILERARKIPNLAIHGAKSPVELATFFRRAACLCCTSQSEGFPNTFLEAWSHGRPVITTFDPDHLIAEQGLGAAESDVNGLVHAIRALLLTPGRWQTASTSARRYYLENHAIDRVMPLFEKAFLSVIGHTPRISGSRR
jgi:glycosyltransferase involved in cell wall biosynthesis